MGGRKHRLKIKVAAACVLFAVVLSVLVGGLGFVRYTEDIEKSCEYYIASIVTMIARWIDVDKLALVLETGVMDEAYETLQIDINDVRVDPRVEYIGLLYYPSGVEKEDLAYVATAYTQQELENGKDAARHLGDYASLEDFGEDLRAEMRANIALKDDRTRTFRNLTYISGRAEYVITAYRPLRDSEGNLVSVLCANISTDDIYDSLHSYLISIAAGVAGVVIVFLVIFLFVLNRQVLRPIQQIAERASDFARQSRMVSDPSELHFEEIVCNTKDEIQMLAESLNHTMGELIGYMSDLRQVSDRQKLIAAEVNVAREIRMSLYPGVFPAFPERGDFDIYADYTSAGGAGEDFYNFFFSDSDHLCFMAGSVSGLGIPSTMFAAITTTVMKNFAKLGYSASRVMAETNNQVSSGNQAGLTAEVFFGKVDLAAGRMEYAAAGDMKALLKTSEQEFAPLEVKSGIRLGSMANVPYMQRSVDLSQGDTLFLYTRGVADTRDMRGNVFSDVYVAESVNQITKREIDLARMAGEMKKELCRFSDGRKQEMDSTMLLFRFYGPGL